MSSFSVVEFVDEVDSDGCKKVDIVPSEFISCLHCILHVVFCTIYVIATCANARAKLHQAEYSSDLTDNENGIRKRKPSVKLMKNQLSSHTESSEPSDSDEELPPTPPEQLLNAASPTCEAMFSKVLAILEEVKETQLVHSKMLNALLKQKNGSVTAVPEGVVLPLKTQDDVEALNGKLEDSSLMSAVVAMVADIGGTSVDDATRRMMKFLISPELAMEYNLLEALKKNSLTAKVNLQEAEKALCKWFTRARDRGGLRAAREQNRLTAL
ncbi:translocation protein SEC63 [Sarotherodon galilaeus]